jgi:tetratricopeptide (TPR) repeat protein
MSVSSWRPGKSLLAQYIPLPSRLLAVLEAGLFLGLVALAVFLWTAPQRQEKRLSSATFPELLEISKREKENPRVFYYLGLRLHQLGHDGPARAALERAATLDTEDEDIWLAWAAVNARFGQDEETFGVLSTYLENHPKSFRAHLALALLYQQIEAHRLAYESAQKASALDPKNTAAYRVMASSALDLRKLADAEGATRRAIALDSQDWRHHYLLGNIQVEDNRLPEALNAYQEAVALSPEEPTALAKLGKLQLATSTDAEGASRAAATLDKSLKANPRQGEAWRELGKAYLRLGQYDKSREALVNAARYAPADEAIAYALRQLAERTGDKAGATKYSAMHERLLQARMERLRLHSDVWQNPKKPEPRLAFARFLAKEGDWRGAVDNYRRLLSLAIIPEDVKEEATKEARGLLERYPQALVGTPLQLPLPEAATTKEVPTPKLLADANEMVKKEKFTEAEQVYKTILARDPESAEAYEGLGLLYDAQGKIPEAFAALQNAITRNPQLHQAQYALAGMYFESGFIDEAAIRMTKVLEKVTDRAEYWHSLGLACMRLEAEERIQQGLVAFRRAMELKPNEAQYIRDLAAMEVRARKFVEAEDHFRKALALQPTDLIALHGLATLLMEEKPTPERLNEAGRLLEQAKVQGGQNPIILAALGAIQMKKNAPREAVPYLEEAVTRNPNDDASWFQLHRAYERLKNRERSQFCLEIFQGIKDARAKLDLAGEKAALNPKNIAYRLELARLYAKTGDNARAINQYDVCLLLDPNNSTAKTEREELVTRLKAKGQLPPMQVFNGMVSAAITSRKITADKEGAKK